MGASPATPPSASWQSTTRAPGSRGSREPRLLASSLSVSSLSVSSLSVSSLSVSSLSVSSLSVSSLSVSAPTLWRLYRDRWAIEQWPLSAKPMLGAERAFVSGQESRYRLPELALLAGNLLSYVAATGTPVAAGFWDRAAPPTCGRLPRPAGGCGGCWRLRWMLARVHCAQLRHCSELPCQGGQLRKKDSVTAHLKKGVEAHRRYKPETGPLQAVQTGAFTGN